MQNKIMSHDQNFKNLLLDHPHQAVAFFAATEAAAIGTARITPVRQEQLQERLGERFRELDVPLSVEWPDGQREALVFVLEEESDARRFSIHRLAHYWQYPVSPYFSLSEPPQMCQGKAPRA